VYFDVPQNLAHEEGYTNELAASLARVWTWTGPFPENVDVDGMGEILVLFRSIRF